MSGYGQFDWLIGLVPVYVLTLVRVAAMMLYAPILGNGRVPRRVKGLLAVAITIGLAPLVPRPTPVPQTAWAAAVAIGGEIVFGLAMGMAVSGAFVATQWAGDIIGQQMGLNLGEVFDPQFGGSSSVVGDLYFMLTTAVFLAVGGHLALVQGVAASFKSLPPGSAGMSANVLDMIVGLIQGGMVLALRLAAPVLMTMLVVDLALGLIGRAMPQFNIMSAGMSVRSVVGALVLIVGIGLTSDVIRQSVLNSLWQVSGAWKGTFVRL